VLTLTCAGIGSSRVELADWRSSPTIGLETVASGLLLFAGFDLGIHRSDQAFPDHAGGRMISAVPILAFLLLGLWGMASLAYVPADRLAETTIPYTLAARSIGGQTGRMLMGIVLITGAAGAVLTLFTASARLIASLAQRVRLPRYRWAIGRGSLLTAVGLTASVATMTATGLAGMTVLETLIRAGFLLWLLHAGLIHIIAPHGRDRKTMDGTGRSRCPGWGLRRLAGMLTVGGTACLWAADEKRLSVLAIMLAVWLGVVLVLWLVGLANHRKESSLN